MKIRRLRFKTLSVPLVHRIAEALERLTGDLVRIRRGHQKRYKIERFNGTRWVLESEG